MSENGTQMFQKCLNERAKRILQRLAQHIKVGYERRERERERERERARTDFGKPASHCSIRNVHNTVHEMLGHHNVCACWVSACLKEENSEFRERSFISPAVDSRRNKVPGICNDK
jgi:hypothetical protein